MSDPIYTPPFLAREMADAITHSHVRRVADIAVGGGELLRAAEQRWPASKLYGLDIDGEAVKRLRRSNKKWFLRRGDLLRETHDHLGWPKCDVLLLNPPFSCRGGTRVMINVAGAEHTASRALACLVAGMSFLEARGQIVALLPAGCLHSEKDAAAWTSLRRNWNVTLVRECQRNTFDSFYPSTVLLHLCRGSAIVEPEAEAITVPLRGKVLLVRGKVQMHSVISGGSGLAPVLHTTSLSPGPLSRLQKSFKEVGNGTVEGLCIILPRVGSPDLKKLVLHRFVEATRLSDCLFGMQCADDNETKLLFQAMRSEWAALCKLYVGTGATFLTLQRLTGFLMRLEYKTEAVQNIRLRTEDSRRND